MQIYKIPTYNTTALKQKNSNYSSRHKACSLNNDCKKVINTQSYVSFLGFPAAKRLQRSDYLISGYIREIGKARNFYGDRNLVDLSMGNPDLTPPQKVKDVLRAKVNDLWSHRYNNPKGEGVLFHTVAAWAKKRFGIIINPRTEVMTTSGSSDAIDHVFTAFANPKDKILIPNPGYSLYDDLITRHDLTKVSFNLFPQNNYLPDFSQMPSDAKILILNYPHNPTGSFANMKIFEEAVKWAKETGTLIIHDMDNSEITHTGIKPVSILQVDGAKDIAFQVHTFSKAQSMPGFRVAFVMSDEENINNLLNAKFLSGGSVYVPVQHAAAVALKDEEGYVEKVNKIYRERKNTTISWLEKLGSNAKASDGTYYLWVKVPPEFTSDEFFKYVLHKSQVAFTPGTVFGSNGEGYVRIVMSAPTDIINKSFERIQKAGIRFDIPKSKLTKDVQREIKMMSDNTYFVESKADRDLKQYKLLLAERQKELETRFADKSEKFQKFMPKLNAQLPWNILKDGQGVYIQDVQRGIPLFGDIKDICPFSDNTEYIKLAEDIKNQWLSNSYTGADILPPYKSQTFYPDAHYITLRSEDGKLQAIMNIELQDDGIMWGRSLNTAPWNQGENGQIRGCRKAVLARMASFCLETGNSVLKCATNKPENIKLYKSIGMIEDGTRNFGGEINTVLKFDKESMQTFLNKYQINLAF
ncbi:MAG: aminotransferase class I/II-fold pyridoxal phosphate-dependent enzyme [bacterium]|nr:aminotransferase class I/II-fold pyridoxal phosphate-dependent enzyme [bacterium]